MPGRSSPPASEETTTGVRLQPAGPTTRARVGGDHVRLVASPELCFGSPPPHRGPHAVLGPVDRIRRFTPASAGPRICASSWPRWERLTPASAGDHLVLSVAVPFGSPPRRRGPRATRPLGPLRPRFTLASARTPSSPASASRRSAVHPGVGGDHDVGPEERGSSGGSPPRRRGPRCRSGRTAQDPRFTPASAGTTRAPTSASTAGSVHPASAGTTSTTPARRTPPPVHPRIGGDHSLSWAAR